MIKGFKKLVLVGIAVLNSFICAKQTNLYLVKDGYIKIDGSLDEYNEFSPIVLNDRSMVTRGEWGGVNDLSAEVYVLMDHKNLYIAAKVKDNVPAYNVCINDSIYNGDCIELYIGEKTADKPKNYYTSTDYQIGIKVSAEAPQVWSWNNVSEVVGRGEIKNAKVVVKKFPDNKGYFLEAAIPLESFLYILPIDGKEYIFDIAVDDGDEGKLRKSQLTWNGDGDGWQKTSVWGLAKAVKVHESESFNIIVPVKKSVSLKGENVKIFAVYNFKPVEQVEIEVEGKKYTTNQQGYAEVLLKKAGRNKITANYKGTTLSKEVVVVIKKEVNSIKINQVGYLPNAQKKFLVDKEATDFEIIDVTNGNVVYKGKLVNKGIDRISKDNVWEGDFTDFKTPGKYKIVIKPTGDESYVFKIGNDIYKDVFYKVMRSYYLQRCGINIDDKITGFKLTACHNRPAVFHPSMGKSGSLEVNGGWHDAGDYGKYIPSAAVTVGQFLLLYEVMPDKFKDKELDIPESGNGVPDILDEVRWELEWMLKMQDKDGVVYHKATTKEFPSLWTPPEKDLDTIYIIGVQSHDVGVFAANMAQAARVYKKFDPVFAEKCLNAAKKAWDWLEKNPFIGFKNPPDVNTGEYPVGQDESARVWAAAELYLATGDEKYHTYFKQNLNKNFAGRGPITNISWDMVHPIGYLSYLFNPKGDPAVKEFIKNQLLQTADSVVRLATLDKNFYQTTLLDFTYTSNKRLLAAGVTLMFADMVSNNPKYKEIMLEQLNYIFGKNPITKCYVTGVGSDYPENPHNRLVLSKGVMIPGLLVQGPNSETLGPKGYYDVADSWLTNENAIDFSAPLVLLLAYFR